MNLQEQANEKINDWMPETLSLLNRLVAAGATLVKSDNGEDECVFAGGLDAFAKHLTACDEAHLHIKTPTSGEKTRWIFLVFGNEPGVLMSDYQIDPLIDIVSDTHYEEWRDKPQPMTTRGAAYPELYKDAAAAVEPKPYDVTGQIIAFESGELDDDATIELFQHLVDTGMAWQMQGSYGRTARSLILDGLVSECKPA